MHLASFFSGRFITAIVVNTPEKKMAKRTSVRWYKRQENYGLLRLPAVALSLKLVPGFTVHTFKAGTLLYILLDQTRYQ